MNYNLTHKGSDGTPGYVLSIEAKPDESFIDHLNAVIDHLILYLDRYESKVHNDIDVKFKKNAPRLARHFNLVKSHDQN